MLSHEAAPSGALLLVFVTDVELGLFPPLMQLRCHLRSSVNAVAALALKNMAKALVPFNNRYGDLGPFALTQTNARTQMPCRWFLKDGTPGAVFARNIDITALLTVVPATTNRRVQNGTCKTTWESVRDLSPHARGDNLLISGRGLVFVDCLGKRLSHFHIPSESLGPSHANMLTQSLSLDRPADVWIPHGDDSTLEAWDFAVTSCLRCPPETLALRQRPLRS